MDKLEFLTRTNPETGATETAVLYSRGYGAGWSTWNRTEIAVDKRVVQHVLENSTLVADEYEKNVFSCEYCGSEENMKDFLKSLGYDRTYCGGLNGLTLEWLPNGIAFRINEYDGAESVEFLDMSDWWVI